LNRWVAPIARLNRWVAPITRKSALQSTPLRRRSLASVGGTDRPQISPNGGSIKRSVAPIEENPPHQGDARNWWVAPIAVDWWVAPIAVGEWHRWDARNWWVAPIAIGGWHRLRLVGGTDCGWWVAPIAIGGRGVAGMARPQVRKKLARLRPSLPQGWGLPSHPKREHRPKNSRQDR
jgi:hypothetical protein